MLLSTRALKIMWLSNRSTANIPSRRHLDTNGCFLGTAANCHETETGDNKILQCLVPTNLWGR